MFKNFGKAIYKLYKKWKRISVETNHVYANDIVVNAGKSLVFGGFNFNDTNVVLY